MSESAYRVHADAIPTLMSFIHLFTIVGTAIGLIRGLPQLIRLLRSRNAHGVSLDSATTTSVVSSAWAAYGFLSGQGAVMLASASSATVFGLIAFGALRFGRSIRELRIAPFWFGSLLLITLIGGRPALGMALSVSILLANGPQVVTAWRESDLSGLSIGTWLVSAAEAIAWGSYGFVAGDRAILTHAALQLVTSGTIVGLRVMKQPTDVRG